MTVGTLNIRTERTAEGQFIEHLSIRIYSVSPIKQMLVTLM